MSIKDNHTDIIILVICIILSIIFMIFINKTKCYDRFSFNCFRKNKYTNYAVMDIEQINNNIKVITIMNGVERKEPEKTDVENMLL